MIRERELLRRVPLCRQTIWRKEQAGDFPKRRQLGPNAVAWFEDEVEAWLNARPIGPIDSATLNVNAAA